IFSRDWSSDVCSSDLDGLEFYEEQEMEGVTFKTLKFVEPTSAYPYGYYTNDNTTFKIVPDVTPLNLWFASKEWYMAYSKVGPTRSEERRVGKECGYRW